MACLHCVSNIMELHHETALGPEQRIGATWKRHRGKQTARSFLSRFLTLSLTPNGSREIRRWPGGRSNNDPHERSTPFMSATLQPQVADFQNKNRKFRSDCEYAIRYSETKSL